MNREHGPQRRCVVSGSAHGAVGQMIAATVQACEDLVEALHDHAALGESSDPPLRRTGPGSAQMLFDAVKMLNLQSDHPACCGAARACN